MALFSEQGIVGVLFFILPWGYIVLRALQRFIITQGESLNELMPLLILLGMQFAVGFSMGFNILFSPWITLALGYLVLYSKDSDNFEETKLHGGLSLR